MPKPAYIDQSSELHTLDHEQEGHASQHLALQVTSLLEFAPLLIREGWKLLAPVDMRRELERPFLLSLATSTG
jgi:hypothetical protein